MTEKFVNFPFPTAQTAEYAKLPIYPKWVPTTPAHDTLTVVQAHELPPEFLDARGERLLASGVQRAAQRTESYIQTSKLRNAIQIQVEGLMEKYNEYIMSLLERINHLQNALRESDTKLATANNKLVALFGSTTRDNIVDMEIRDMFDGWGDVQSQIDKYITSAAAVANTAGTGTAAAE